MRDWSVHFMKCLWASTHCEMLLKLFLQFKLSIDDCRCISLTEKRSMIFLTMLEGGWCGLPVNREKCVIQDSHHSSAQNENEGNKKIMQAETSEIK